jgi:hypothetical protein
MDSQTGTGTVAGKIFFPDLYHPQTITAGISGKQKSLL